MSTMLTDDEAKRNVAGNVNCRLESLGWTQSDLARATGENKMVISAICRGENASSGARLSRIAEALGVTVDFLLKSPGRKLSRAS